MHELLNACWINKDRSNQIASEYQTRFWFRCVPFPSLSLFLSFGISYQQFGLHSDPILAPKMGWPTVSRVNYAETIITRWGQSARARSSQMDLEDSRSQKLQALRTNCINNWAPKIIQSWLRKSAGRFKRFGHTVSNIWPRKWSDLGSRIGLLNR
jgi:hypothetical protein